MSPTLLTLLLTTTVATPEITGVAPTPLPLSAVAEVTGAGFVPDGTSVAIGGVAQQVFNVQVDRIRLSVAADTPLGTQRLVVTVTTGQADIDVQVVPPLPRISDVTPDQLTLGKLATIQGEDLDTATAVSVGNVAASIREQTAFVIVFEVPFDEAILGDQVLRVTSPSGAATRNLTVVPPTPEIDAIAPNPARQGDLITIRGSIVPLNVRAKIGGVDAPSVVAETGAVTVLVPDTVEVGPHDVTVSVGVLTSPPQGPLYIQMADPDHPVVTGVFPANVAKGGQIWIVGEDLDTVTTATHGLVVDECDRTACRVGAGDAEVGTPFTAAVSGSTGAAVFTMSVLDEAPVEPVITSVSPQPALRGEALTISGERMQTLKTVVIGGKAQSVVFFRTNEIEITVSPDTPLGAERLFVTTNTGSEPFEITVLDPFPSADAGADVGDDATPPADEDPHEDTSTGGGDGGACSGGGGPAAPLTGLLGLLGPWLVRRRRAT